MNIEIVDAEKKVVETVEVEDGIFDAEVKEHLIHDVIRMQLANRRRGTHSTKGRSEVTGTTNKPWRQKGTGRARAGTTKSPLWIGGGITFGPKPRDYSYLVPKKVRKGALRSAVSMKVKEGTFTVIDGIEFAQPKTKEMVGLLKGLGLSGSTLILMGGKNPNLELSARNIPGVKMLNVAGLNVYDIVRHDNILCLKEALGKVQEALTK